MQKNKLNSGFHKTINNRGTSITLGHHSIDVCQSLRWGDEDEQGVVDHCNNSDYSCDVRGAEFKSNKPS